MSKETDKVFQCRILRIGRLFLYAIRGPKAPRLALLQL